MNHSNRNPKPLGKYFKQVNSGLNAISKKYKGLNRLDNKAEVFVLQKQFYNLWREFISALPFYEQNILWEYIDSNNQDYENSHTLRIRDILPKSRSGITRFYDTEDGRRNNIRIEQVVKYTSWIFFCYYQWNITEEVWSYIVFQSCLIVAKHFDLMHLNIFPQQILNVTKKIRKDFMNNIPFNKPRPSIYAPSFTLKEGQNVSQATGEHRFKKIEQWLNQCIGQFYQSYDRYPCLDEIQSMLQKKFASTTDKTFKMFLTHGKVSRPTLDDWLDKAGLKGSPFIIRKKKGMVLHL